jgi:dipeptidyl aminopeptidase/acylaminoacyl peptidase
MDQSVPSIQSLELTEQLIKNGKDVELHIYEDGLHGLSLSKANGTVAQWKSSLIKWLLHHDFNITEGY